MSKVMKYDALAHPVNFVVVYPAGKNFSWKLSVDNLGKIK
jgi:poly(3-hydroxybutyrate) depolymerase